MVVEHVFVTTLEMDEALGRTRRLLTELGFRPKPSVASCVHAVRGRKRPNSRKLIELPQVVQVEFDRGRITVAAGITLRRGKDLPIHAQLMTALARGLELLLVEQAADQRAAEEFLAVQAGAPTLWLSGEKAALWVLVALLGLIVVLIVVALVAASS